MTRFDDIGVCFDFGHAHIMGGVPESFESLKALIRSTHVHDNARDRDAHLWPGEGTINWDEALGLLRAAPHVPPLLMEIEGEGQELSKVPARMAEVFQALAAKGEKARAS